MTRDRVRLSLEVVMLPKLAARLRLALMLTLSVGYARLARP